MKSKRNLMTVLIGLAIFATPIAAAAKDHHHDAASTTSTSHPSHTTSFHASSAPARSFATTRVGTVDEYRNQGAVAHRDWVENHPGWNRGYAYGRPAYYGNRPYYAGGPAYYGAPGYAGGGYGGGGSCAQARSIMSTYESDRYRGHPAAAADVLRQNEWAFRSGCGSPASAAMGPGLFSGFRGFGGAPAPAYGNYGGGYGQPYGGGYGGGQPYGGGYGQPGGGLGGILQQFIH
jgi:hypothetical protein